MKVVINACYGGFNLSAACMLELIKLKSKIVKEHDYGNYYGNDWPSEVKTTINKAEKFGLELPENWHFIGGKWPHGILDAAKEKIYSIENHGNYNYETDVYDWSNRTDPELIKLIEKHGSKWASGFCSELKVVEIPDNTDFEIDEYDGYEKVDEKHRSWS